MASYLRSVAATLDAGDAITLAVGERTVTVELLERPTFDVEAEREPGRAGTRGGLGIELERVWREGQAVDAGDHLNE